jgi:hypothetical protein
VNDQHAKMVGFASGDPHKNTSSSKHVNDRDRRKRKRQERDALKSAIRSGALLASIFTRR